MLILFWAEIWLLFKKKVKVMDVLEAQFNFITPFSSSHIHWHTTEHND